VELARTKQAPRIIDVGTGSGCIALALAAELPWARVEAVDISPAALEVARANAARLQLDHRIIFQQRDLLAGGPVAAYDFVVSNPPYVPESEPEKAQCEVREFEPKVAVFAGESGLEVYRRLVPQAREALKPGGWLVVEIGYSLAAAVHELVKDWAEVRVTPDLQGIPRVVAARRQ
jgi:release factor glutamine methyltransferase